MPAPYTPRLLLLILLQFAFGLGFASFHLLPKFLTEEHGATGTTIGLVTAAGSLAAVAVIPVLAAYIDRVSRRAVMVAGAIALGVGSLGFVLSPGLSLLTFGFRALHGAGFTLFMGAGTALVADLSPRDRLAQSLGLLGAANVAANAAAPAIAEPLAASSGWTAVFFLGAAMALVSLFGTTLVQEPRRAAVRERAASAGSLWQSRFLRLIYAGAMVGVAFGTVSTFYQPLALELGIRTVGDLFIGFSISALAVRVLLGGFLDRFDRRRLVLGATTLYVAMVLATAALQPGWLFLLGLGLGFAHGTLWPVLSALSLDGADASTRGALVTYLGGSFHLGVMLSSLGFGVVAEAWGYRVVIALSGALIASAVLCLAGVRSSTEALPLPLEARR